VKTLKHRKLIKLIKPFLFTIILFMILYSSELHDIYVYYTSPDSCDKYILYYNCFIYVNNSFKRVENIGIILYYHNNNPIVQCNIKDNICNVLNRIYTRVSNIHPNLTGGYRFDGSPSFLLYLYRGSNESYNFIPGKYGSRIIVYASVVYSNRSYTYYLVRQEASYKCYELNTPFYIAMLSIKLALSALIVGAIFMAYRTWFRVDSK